MLSKGCKRPLLSLVQLVKQNCGESWLSLLPGHVGGAPWGQGQQKKTKEIKERESQQKHTIYEGVTF